MQLVTSRTNLPQAHASFSQRDFSEITRSLEQKKHAVSLHPFFNFQGQISIGEFLFPIEKFTLKQNNKYVFIENFPINSFPKIQIVLEEKNSVYGVKEFKVTPSGDLVQGEILYTRFYFAAIVAKRCSLHFTDIDFGSFNFGFSDITLEEKEQMLFRAKLFRKLRFIERVFEKIKFSVPDRISADEAGQIEVLFKALTEGEFTYPSNTSVPIYNYTVSKYDLENNFPFSTRKFSLEFSENFLVLGKFFDIGKVIVRFDKASVANPWKIRNIREKEVIENLRLSIYDSQIHYTFEKYNNSERLSKNKQKLEQYRKLLQNEESNFLASMLDEPLTKINEKAAIEALEALLQYYDFPDRFSVLKPKLEGNQWRVPIALTYPEHDPIWLVDAFVDVKTGKVEMKISFDKLLKKGKKKAKEVLSIA